jgi:predicted  nucleic acid-binding Zn-ribbon protein
MTLPERIAALQQALDTLNAAIASLRAALDTATDPAQIAQLNAQLADMDAERQQVEFELANLQMANGQIAAIAPDAVARIQALSGELGRLDVRGATISATLDFANSVLGKVSQLRQAAS